MKPINAFDQARDMRHQYTSGQVRMLVERAHLQLAQIAGDWAQSEPVGKHIPKPSQFVFHETVVGLIKLFREHVPGATSVATMIAREYAKGADATQGAPTLACARAIAAIVRDARVRYLSASDMETS